MNKKVKREYKYVIKQDKKILESMADNTTSTKIKVRRNGRGRE